MTETVYSKNGVPIRLTDERWAHIIEEHGELAGRRLELVETVADPTEIFAGGAAGKATNLVGWKSPCRPLPDSDG